MRKIGQFKKDFKIKINTKIKGETEKSELTPLTLSDFR
jgi:hypothetical protein